MTIEKAELLQRLGVTQDLGNDGNVVWTYDGIIAPLRFTLRGSGNDKREEAGGFAEVRSVEGGTKIVAEIGAWSCNHGGMNNYNLFNLVAEKASDGRFEITTLYMGDGVQPIRTTYVEAALQLFGATVKALEEGKLPNLDQLTPQALHLQLAEAKPQLSHVSGATAEPAKRPLPPVAGRRVADESVQEVIQRARRESRPPGLHS